MWLSHRCRPTKVHQPNFVFRTKHIQSTLPKQILATCISLVWAMGSPLMSPVLFCLNSASMYVDLKWLVGEFMPKVALYWWLSTGLRLSAKYRSCPRKTADPSFNILLFWVSAWEFTWCVTSALSCCLLLWFLSLLCLISWNVGLHGCCDLISW